MIQTILAKVVGTQNERELKRLRPIVGQVNAFEPVIQPLSDEALRAKTAEFRQRLAQGETNTRWHVLVHQLLHASQLAG